MKIWHFIAAVVIGAAGVTYATVSGNYQVKVQFVPPLVNAPCTLGRWWQLPNMTCAMCFCMTGTLSRCLPQPGCLQQPSNATTPSTPITNGTETATDPMVAGGNESPGNETSVSMGTEAPSSSSAAPPSTNPPPSAGTNAPPGKKPV